MPLFDYDEDGCYPASAVDANGTHNGGLDTTGSTGGGCKSNHLGDTKAFSSVPHDGNHFKNGLQKAKPSAISSFNPNTSF
ncbi:NPP1 family protein [Streptomyces sp. NPDC054940]